MILKNLLRCVEMSRSEKFVTGLERELRWLRQEFRVGPVSLLKKLTISFYLSLKATRQRREIKTFALVVYS